MRKEYFYQIRGNLGANKTRLFSFEKLLSPSEIFNMIIKKSRKLKGLKGIEIKRSNFVGELFEYKVLTEKENEIFIIYE